MTTATPATAPAAPAAAPGSPRRARAAWLLSDTVALTGRSVRHMVRQIDGLLLSVVLPVLLMLLFVNVFGGAIAIGTRYLDYVLPGIIVLTAGYGASQAAIAVTGDLTTGSVDRFRSMPISPASLLGGHALASLLRNLLSTAIVVGVALAMGFRPVAGPLGWLGVIGMVALFVVAMTWVAVLIGVVATSVDAASGFSFFVLFLPYISSAFVPPETLPAVLRPIAEHQPITPVIETMRGLLLGAPVGSSGWLAVLWCAGILALAVPAAAGAFRRRMWR